MHIYVVKDPEEGYSIIHINIYVYIFAYALKKGSVALMFKVLFDAGANTNMFFSIFAVNETCANDEKG